MIEICDQDTDLNVLKKLIKMNTGHDIKLTKEQICLVYDDIRAGRMPFPPLIMSSDKTYLIDKKSPLNVRDYDILFASSSTRNDIKRVARKVGLGQIEQMTKGQMIDSIGRRLRYMNVYEPIKIGRKTIRRSNNTAVNNTAVNNTAVNNTAVNNTAVNNTAVNNFMNNMTINNRNNTTINNRNNGNSFQKGGKNFNKPPGRVNFPTTLFGKNSTNKTTTTTRVTFPNTVFKKNPFKSNNATRNQKPNNTVQNQKPNNMVQNQKPNNVVRNQKPNNVVQNQKPNNVVRNQKPNNMVRNQKPNNVVRNQKFPNDRVSVVKKPNTQNTKVTEEQRENVRKLQEERKKVIEEQRENMKRLQEELAAAEEKRKKDATNTKQKAKVENLQRQIKEAEERRIRSQKNANTQRMKQKLKEAEERRKKNITSIKQRSKAEQIQRNIRKTEEKRIRAQKNANTRQMKQKLKESEEKVKEEAEERRIRNQKNANAKKMRDEEKRVIDKGRNRLSNMVLDAKMENNFMNKVTTIKTLTNLKNVENQIVSAIDSKRNANKAEISNYMKKLGLNNQDIRIVLSRNLSVNSSRKEANTILAEKKRLKFTKLLDEKKIPVANRKQFYNKIDQANIESVINDYIKNKSRETTNDITKVLNKYNLKKEDKQSILNEWNRNRNMTLGQAKNQASRRAAEFKKEKETALRLYMKNELKLNPADTETVMESFEINSRNMGALRTKAMNLLKLSDEKNRIAERIRKAREDNQINMKIKTNIKNMKNVKKFNNKINQVYIGKAKKTLARRALNHNVTISEELNQIKTMNDIQKVQELVDKIIDGKKEKDRKELENVIKNLKKEEQNRILQKFKAQNNTLGNLLQNAQNLKNDIVAEQEKVKKIVRNSVPGVMGQYRRGWEGAINKARTPKELKDIQDLLANKVMLRNQIEQSNLDEKRGHLSRVMSMKNDVNRRRRIFEKQLKKPIYESNEENNNKFKTKIYNNPVAVPTMTNNPIYANNLNTEKKKQNEEAAAASKKLVNNALKKVKLNAEKKKQNEEAAAASKKLVNNALKKVKLNAEKKKQNEEAAAASKKLVNNALKKVKLNAEKKKRNEEAAAASKKLVNNALKKVKLNAEKKKRNEEAAAASKKLVNNALKKVKLNAEKKKRNEEAAANALKKVKLNAEKNRLKNLVKKSKLNTNPFWAIEINALTNVNKGKNIEKKIKNKLQKKPIYESNEENNKKFKTKIYNNPMAAPTMTNNPMFSTENKKPSFKAIVQKNKERRVMNAVKTASQKTAVSRATGTERVKLARKFAPSTQADVKKANNAGKVFKTNTRKVATTEKRATLSNKSSYQGKINSQYFKLPRNRKKLYTSRIQKATTLGQVLKAYNNAEKERNANLKK